MRTHAIKDEHPSRIVVRFFSDDIAWKIRRFDLAWLVLILDFEMGHSKHKKHHRHHRSKHKYDDDGDHDRKHGRRSRTRSSSSDQSSDSSASSSSSNKEYREKNTSSDGKTMERIERERQAMKEEKRFVQKKMTTNNWLSSSTLGLIDISIVDDRKNRANFTRLRKRSDWDVKLKNLKKNVDEKLKLDGTRNTW